MEVINKRRKVLDSTPNLLFAEPRYKPEIIRLIIQSLRSFGFSESASQLESESGIILEEKSVSEFKVGVLEGRWDEVAALIPTFNLRDEEKVQVTYCVMQQKYLELIEKGDYLQALECLRNEVVPLKPEETNTLHVLASHLLCSSSEELKEDANWEGSTSQARTGLLHKAQSYIPPSVMVPPDRLQDLVSQALQSQVTSCKFHHASEEPMSLLEDHTCVIESLIITTIQHIQSMDDEVWDCAFSKNGNYLAIMKNGGSLVVWKSVESHWTQEFELDQGHIDASSVAWGSDDTIIVGGKDGSVKIVGVDRQEVIKVYLCHTGKVSSACWAGNQIVTGSVDNELHFLKSDGEKLYTTQMRVRQIEVSEDGMLVAVLSASNFYSARNQVHLFDSSSHLVIKVLEEADYTTAIALARNGQEMLTNTSFQHPVS